MDYTVGMSESSISSDLVGKKIFFLYPTVVVQNRIISELVQQEYETYATRNKDALARLLRKYPDSVVFVDINEEMKEKEWESWIVGIMQDPQTKDVAIGIVSANDDELIKRKYLLAVKVRCGYTALKSDLDKAITRLLKVLHEINAKGRRKFIRATTANDSNTTLNLPHQGAFLKGQILDISVAGISCTLDGSPDITKNTLFKDIQIKLHSNLLKAEGIVIGSRKENNETVYVILFTQRIDPNVRTRIRKFIQQHLQTKMDAELK